MSDFEQRTTIDQIEIARDGVVRARLDKQLLRDGVVIGGPNYHRCTFEPGADFDASLKAINDHLASMKAAPVDDAEWDMIRPHLAVAQTPEVIERFKAAREARLAKLEAASTGTIAAPPRR